MKKTAFALLAFCLFLSDVLPSDAAIFDNGGKPLSAILSQTGDLSYPAQLRQIYGKRDDAPFWSFADTKQAQELVEALLLIANGNGMEDQSATAQKIRNLLADDESVKNHRTEIALLDWILKIAHDLNGDSLPLAQLYTGWEFSRSGSAIPADLAKAITSGDIITYLVSLAPSDAAYLHLIEGLKLYRAYDQTGGWKEIDAGPTLKPGMKDPRVRQVRARLEAEAYTLPLCRNEAEEATYDEALKDVVIQYQLRNGLEADGNLGSKSLAVMNKSAASRVAQIRANMARLRAMPREWPARSAIINIADASAVFYTPDHAPYLAPVIVGRPDRKTPFIDSKIDSVILNPSWSVPDKIAREDILPKLKKDPHYLQKMGMVIRQNEDDPYGTQIDWDQLKKNEFVFRLRQAPGELNALGPIKFDFNNDFAVYMHGTPHKELFVKAERHLSSGCVRLLEPDMVAELILSSNDGGWTRQKVNEEIAKNDRRWMKVKNPMPVFFIYQTVFYPTGSATPHFRRDVYNYDKPLLAAMQDKEKPKTTP